MKYENSRAKSTSQKKSGGGTFLGLFIGLVLGVLIAAGVVWFLHRTPLPFQGKDAHPAEAKAAPAAATPDPAAAPGTPLPLPGKPGDKPRFEFYKILPSGQTGAPSPGDPKQASGAPAAPAPTATPVPTAPSPTPAPAPVATATTETFYLQVGAFQKSADADNMKARLALLGVDAHVQQVQTPDKGALFRVRVGGYSKPEEMNRVRTQLSQNGIQTSVIKVKTEN